MKSRWLLNLILFVAVAGIALALYLTPKKQAAVPTDFVVSEIEPSTISKILVEFPAKQPVEMEKRDGDWFLVQPYAARAGQAAVDAILGILRAHSFDKLSDANPAQFGLDNPAMRLKLDKEEFTFGTFNPVNGQQYVGYKNSVYLLPNSYSDAAATQVVELIDKDLLAPREQVAGFDFSHLEQWEATGLRIKHEGGQWQVSVATAKPGKKAMDDWFGDGWKTLAARSVEKYKPDSKETYPYFDILLKDGKKIHVDKIQESPELLLYRPDEGILYHFAQDLGFQLLNPPVGIPK